MNKLIYDLSRQDDLDDEAIKSAVSSLSEEEAKETVKDLIYEYHHACFKGRKRVCELYDASAEQLRLFGEQPDIRTENMEKAYDDAKQNYENKRSGRKQTKPRKNKRETIDRLPVVTKDVYPTCAEYLEVKDLCHELSPEISEEIVTVPASMYTSRTVMHQYAYADEHGDTHIFTADNPAPKLISGSYLSPSLAAQILVSKAVLDIPLYRMSKYYAQSGLYFSRQLLSNWIIQISEMYLVFLFQMMLKDYARLSTVHLDETPLRVLANAAAGGNKYGTIICGRSGKFEEKQMILYVYSESKAMENFAKILPEDYSGNIICDAAPNHEFFKDASLCFCMAHARRKFTDVLKARIDYKQYQKLKTKQEQEDFLNKQPNAGLRVLLEIIIMFSELYRIESRSIQLKETPEEIQLRRQRESKPAFAMLSHMIHKAQQGFLPSSPVGQAIACFINHEKGLSRFLEDGRVAIDDNACERAIKSFVMARKNFLFSNTNRGAEATAVAFSIIESAAVNGLRPEAYLTYVLDTLRKEGAKEEVVRRLLPYSKQLPKELYSCFDKCLN